MLDLKKIAVTGGVSSGKTTVCRFFKELGAFVLSADELTRDLLTSRDFLKDQIVELLGPEVLDKKGDLDRQVIAEKVFNNSTQLRQLEQLLHPLVYEQIKTSYEKIALGKTYTLFIVEIPLLFESQNPLTFDATIAVFTDEELAKERAKVKGIPLMEYQKRMGCQLSPQIKASKADYVITNNGSMDDLKHQVIALNKQLTGRAKHSI